MISEIASIGDKLELKKTFRTMDSNNKEVTYTSQILDITADNVLNIAMPIEKGRLIPLSVDDKYQMFVYSNRGLYQCNILITNRYKEGNVHILTVQILSELEKFQRRQFYRLDCILDVPYRVISELETKIIEKALRDKFTTEEKIKWNHKLEELQKEWYQGTVTDLSGGGARFISEIELEKGSNVSLALNLQIGTIMKQLNIQGVVISSVKLLDRIGYYEHRIKYVDILKEERETIIKFIFEEERRLRKREKEKKG